ncbi:hypothetical protein GGS23DRAFT_285456 [Durotheca rogersii]|uniref:uncharacterized protein n=1 Tax=Durotheca rogersii TaxID=419775 RepID=UPI00221F5900|nr:uncharacterized protein GGS23DRAFT_285456 [Durotheca rogersii]KAI5866744.1 hypothetical protein GGS23DRAFT_285456 [Durotheca rogersii]
MAALQELGQSSVLATNSSETALCLVPPKHLWPAVENLRSRYDAQVGKWPPHVNLVYPFVPVDRLPNALELILSRLRTRNGNNELYMRLDTPGVFRHARKNTIFIHDQDPEHVLGLVKLREIILEALGQTPNDYHMHMTVAQTEDPDLPPHIYTLEKAGLLPTLEWIVDRLYVLIRDRNRGDGDSPTQMKVWGEIDLASLTLSPRPSPTSFYQDESTEGHYRLRKLDAISTSNHLDRAAYTFSLVENRWISRPVGSPSQQEPAPETLTVASYNVQAEFQYPPTRARYPIIVNNLLEQHALADVLILEEVTDDFLSHLCGNEGVRQHYGFVSAGPPSQADIEPLPNHLNVVVLSKWYFSWALLSSPTAYKDVVVARFDNIGRRDGEVFLPVILTAIHLTSGFTNASVDKKKQELQSILKYLSRVHPQNPWVLAGDFNVTSSVYTVETALRRKEISARTKSSLSTIDVMLAEYGLVDTWAYAYVQYGDSSGLSQGKGLDGKALGGEQGATFDPTINNLAADSVRGDFEKRPQRYDRILAKVQGALDIMSFSMFGQSMGTLQPLSTISKDGDGSRGSLSYGSDHWGIRCSFNICSETPAQLAEHANSVPVKFKPASGTLADISQLTACLSNHSVFPSEVDATLRETALKLLREVLIQREGAQTRGLPPLVIVPVGSYGLGVWTASSDIDCLCIGSISSNTFFALAIQRLRAAAQQGVKILRRVDANSGTMLELEVGGIKMDLQYCPAGFIASTWPAAATLPSTDPAFRLSTSVLAKLKPMRDLYYLLRTVPDLAAFKLAHQLVKYWAGRRGIYAAKFGYLNGIQISVLLSRVHKSLSRDGRPVSVPTILTTFFEHYASFDWKKEVVFDPFFHKRLGYVRTAREPMAILGFHGPGLNTAQAASVPTVHVISREFERANTLLSREGVSWPNFLGDDTGAAEFLSTYRSYIKITAQFWGISLAKGNGFVGWLESRCALLLVDLNKSIPQIKPRIWPARFVDREASGGDTEYQGYYLIGLDAKSSDSELPALTLGSVQTALYKFEDQIRGDAKYFDAKTCWVSATVAAHGEVETLRVDDREWGKYTAEAEDDDIGDAEFWASVEAGEEAGEGYEEQESSLGEAGRRKKGGARPLAVRPAYEGKFRSAGDVLSRLRWDPAMDSGDYLVGYEDRFAGAMERPVDAWKSETTDEEFIPEHRIMYFKRRSDGAMVWDREKRRDDIFGSGISSLPNRAGTS